MPKGASSRAALRVSCRTEAFAAPYAASPGKVARIAVEAMLTMAKRDASWRGLVRMAADACCMAHTRPCTERPNSSLKSGGQVTVDTRLSRCHLTMIAPGRNFFPLFWDAMSMHLKTSGSMFMYMGALKQMMEKSTIEGVDMMPRQCMT